MAIILPFKGKQPNIASTAFIAPNAVLVGDVTIGEEASIWFGAVLRGDDPDNGIIIGAGSSIQDNCVIHVGGWGETRIGEQVTIGHGAKLESCEIGDRTVVGMNSVILQNARIGIECVIGANSVVLEKSDIPNRSLVVGAPGVIKRTLDENSDWIARGGTHYINLSREYLEQGLGQPETTLCELCGGPLLERHCKIICLSCGYQRDCSDP
tara:strand:+ start:1623 stop:2252 length:630 start_codon:yes stop_codon:yes gene_type:complete